MVQTCGLWKYKNYITAIGMGLMTLFFIYAWQRGLFTSEQELNLFLQAWGLAAPLLFLLLHVVQVVFPIIPGGLGCLAGVLLFGPIYGFIYNYIGISIGSILVFLLGRYYGKDFIRNITGQVFFDKYSPYLSHEKGFGRWFALLIFLPVAPDDLLCYLAGLSDLSLKRFSAIILLGKPFSIALYSLGLYSIFQFIT